MSSFFLIVDLVKRIHRVKNLSVSSGNVYNVKCVSRYTKRIYLYSINYEYSNC